MEKWRILPKKGLLWEYFENDYILYNPFSGETHLLNEIAAEALNLLQNEPLSLESLTQRLCTVLSVKNDPASRLQVQSLLKEFEELGLIEPFLN